MHQKKKKNASTKTNGQNQKKSGDMSRGDKEAFNWSDAKLSLQQAIYCKLIFFLSVNIIYRKLILIC